MKMPRPTFCPLLIALAHSLLSLASGVSQAPKGGFDSPVSLASEVVSIDLDARAITMDWFPLLEGNCSELSNDPTVVDIYLHPMLMHHSSPTWRPDTPHPPVFRLDSGDLCPVRLWPGEVSFRTVTKLFPVDSRVTQAPKALISRSLYRYPRERVRALFEFSVNDTQTGRISALTVYNLTTSILNFDIQLDSAYVKPGPRSRDSILAFSLVITRSSSTQVIVYVTAIIIWIAAMGIFGISMLSWREHDAYSTTTRAWLLPVPFVGIFLLTDSRSHLPGVPAEFGASETLRKAGEPLRRLTLGLL
ncbi:hypothetical protein CC2G_011060 [Coprinopsis cinerea AmutBmut pab1-1]|nr:hypothetical protein CC2G_011060 [Coprinopsis cinerea AmutBmut pab1-1]